jgi:antitoxin (DNA-binding transcriptional repressor) of toxin-antitoxin stability system
VDTRLRGLGVKRLKARLSEYLRAVKRGEVVVVTDRDQVVAELRALWRRCDVWELSPAVCRLAADVAPGQRLRTLDALHLAPFVLARERIAGLELLTADERLREAAS